MDKESLKSAFDDLVREFGRLPNNLVALGIIVIMITTYQVITPEQYDLVEQPLLNALYIAIAYFGLVSVARVLKPPYDKYPIMPGAVLARSATNKPLPDDVFERICVHEAGHILALALGGDLPVEVKAYVRRHEAQPNGNVSYRYSGDPDSEFRKLEMLFALGGLAAELVVYGEHKDGSAKDNQDWESAARMYMSSYYDDYTWFIDPQNSAEAEVNRSTLKSLRSEQLELLNTFFSTNKDILLTIATEIGFKKSVETELVHEWLNGVQAAV